MLGVFRILITDIVAYEHRDLLCCIILIAASTQIHTFDKLTAAKRLLYEVYHDDSSFLGTFSHINPAVNSFAHLTQQANSLGNIKIQYL